jgi:Cu(I)/Ag(I) efflux system membrane protein CusA/SilA
MIEKIIELSIKNKFLVILGTLFIILGGTYALLRTPLDAIPDLSDVQVIIFTEYPGQAPQVVEDQVTYPLTTAMSADHGHAGGSVCQGGTGLFLFWIFICLCYF